MKTIPHFIFEHKYTGHRDAVHWTGALNFVNCLHVLIDFLLSTNILYTLP